MRILSPDFRVIAHEVNPEGLMKRGLGLQIAHKYPLCAEMTREFALTHNTGDIYVYYRIDKVIINCFSKKNGRTNYKDLKSCVDKIKQLGFEEVAIMSNYKDKKALEIWKRIENLYIIRVKK